jgi:diguanylate cyclase (GGDEF)-like protein
MTVSPSVIPVVPNPIGALTVGTLPEAVSAALAQWASERSLSLSCLDGPDVDLAALHRSRPAVILLGTEGDQAAIRETLRRLKADARLQTIPTVVAQSRADVAAWLEAGADDVVSTSHAHCEIQARLNAALRRSVRDIQVNPSTRLVGADAITDAIAVRMEGGEQFAACYADLDHFKEFNDRYGFAMGDDVIRTVAMLLVDVVEATSGAAGFVGHIGGDDFLFLVPLATLVETCETLVKRADEILPQRYSAHDRQAGYFFGKDRRGRLDRVPLMTLSIGVVTNERRRFSSTAQVSELATEMKTYAKTLPGSVWAIDRRSDSDPSNPPEEKLQ